MKYAMNLEMKGRPCVVLGGGPVALRKARTLVRAEARVTDDAAVNARAATAAKARGVLVNAPAQPELSDFTVPASFSRGRLMFTVSTDGGSPGLSRAIRRQLEELYPAAFGDWLETVAALREGVKEQLATARDREAFWRRALNPEILELVRTGHLLEAKGQVIHAAHLSGAES